MADRDDENADEYDTFYDEIITQGERQQAVAGTLPQSAEEPGPRAMARATEETRA
jgi:hypothetical protein